MKSALAYIRISDDEQSHFSIEGQQRHIMEYCERAGIHLHECFIDNGYSAKDFNRPAWKRLKELLKSQPGQHTYLIVYKYDRMIRNAMEGLSQIAELEKKHQLTIISVCENLGLNPHSPYFKKVRADILVNAEFERDVISHRVRFGMNQAMRNGRYLHQAPFGYTNSRDAEDKPLLVINEAQAKIVQFIYDQYVQLTPQQRILQEARAMGFTHTGKSALTKILRNPIYAGMVRATSFEGQPAELVDAVHEPIVSRSLWWTAQKMLDMQVKVMAPKITSEAMPLRGFLRCENGHVLTGCLSTGKSGQKFPYYKCNQCSQSLSAGKAHADLDQILESLSLLPEESEFLLLMVKDILASARKEYTTKLAAVEKRISACQRTIESIEDKFVRDSISQATYERQMKKYHEQLHYLNMERDTIVPVNDFTDVDIQDAINKIANLPSVYNASTVYEKLDLMAEIFPMGLIRSKNEYRTPTVAPMLAMKATSNVPLKITGIPSTDGIPPSGPQENQIEHFLRFMNRMPMTA